MGQAEVILSLIEKLKHEINVLEQERANLEGQNRELLSALSKFTECIKADCKKRKAPKK